MGGGQGEGEENGTFGGGFSRGCVMDRGNPDFCG